MATVSSSSSSTSSSYGSTYSSNRVTGLFSNLDTDALVESMCSTQQSKIDKVKQKETREGWLEDAYQSVEDTVNTFQNTYASVTGSSSMLKTSTYYSYNVTSDSASNTAVSVSASSTSGVGTYSVQVNQLATNASVSSSSVLATGTTSLSSSTTLANLSLKTKLTFDSSSNLSFTINNKKFTFSSSTTLQSMLNTINNDTTANVTMKFSNLTGGFSVTADSGGASSSVSITNNSGNAFGSSSAFGIATGLTKNGTDAIAVINGTTVTKDSNEFTIDNVTYSLNAVTKGTSDESITFNVKRDYSATVDAVQKFVDAFNTMITSLTSLTTEKDYSTDYPPLTEAQETDMTTEQITAWNTKAKSGLLRNNTDLENYISDLKNSFYSALGGTGQNATSIGITTAGYYESNAGELVLDTDTLKSALESDPDSVVALFTNGSSSSTSTEQGLMYKLKGYSTNYVSTLKTSISTSETRIDSYSDDATDLEDKLDDLADRYYAKFSAMETALSKLNSQSSYISQLFSS